jgi:hypothetical protein
MLELNILILEICIILTINILIFIFSLVSTDILITSLSFLIFLILIIPFHLLLEELELITLLSNLENSPFYKMIIFYSWALNIFIGISLFVELIYLVIYC